MSRETMAGKEPMSDGEEFDCSSDVEISSDSDSDGSERSDKSSSSLDLGVDAIESATKIARNLLAAAKKEAQTISALIAKLKFIQCECKKSGIPDAGMGLFVEKKAKRGCLLQILSLPEHEYTGNFFAAPENCVLVNYDRKTKISTYQKWLQIRESMNGYPPAIGGYANAPPFGKRRQANAMILKISCRNQNDGMKLEYATILVATCDMEAGEEIFVNYDNSEDNKEYFSAQKLKEAGNALHDGEPSSGNKQKRIEIDAGNGGSASSAAESKMSSAADDFKNYFLIKYVIDQNGPLEVYETCKCRKIEFFLNGKPHKTQKVVMRNSGKKKEVNYFTDMLNFYHFCLTEKVFCWPWMREQYVLAKRPDGKCLISEQKFVIGEEYLQFVEVLNYWPNELSKLFGKNGPYEFAFNMMFKLFRQKIPRPLTKNTSKRQKLPAFCLANFAWLPDCVRKLKALEFLGQANYTKISTKPMCEKILLFVQQDVREQLLAHKARTCACFGSRFTVVDDDSAAAGGSARAAKDT